MKKLLIVLIIFLVACSVDEEDCQDFALVDEWVSEDFKTEYTIQFPASYEGIGMTGFEGNLFFKNAEDNSISLQYSFCSPLYCEDFGNRLAEPRPDMISITSPPSNITINLPEKKLFCRDAFEFGILYYNLSSESTGILYMNHEGEWLESLYVEFNKNKLEELFLILGTISPK